MLRPVLLAMLAALCSCCGQTETARRAETAAPSEPPPPFRIEWIWPDPRGGAAMRYWVYNRHDEETRVSIYSIESLCLRLEIGVHEADFDLFSHSRTETSHPGPLENDLKPIPPRSSVS